MKITIPETLNEIPLHKFQEYMKLMDEVDSDFVLLKTVAIFCDMKLNDVKAIRSDHFDEIIAQLNKTLDNKVSFLNRFKMGEVEYGFIPDLDADLSIGEKIDINTYLSDIKTFHKAMGVMFRPITYSKGEKYLIEEYDGKDRFADAMKYAPLDVFLGAKLFFWNLGKELIQNTAHYLQQEAKTNIQLKQILEADGDGINQSMQWLKDDFWTLMPSLN